MKKKWRSQPLLVSWVFFFFFLRPSSTTQTWRDHPNLAAQSLALKSRQLVFGSLFSLGYRCGGGSWHVWHGGAGGSLWRALVGPQENFVFGGHLPSPTLLVGQEFLETGCCKGESLPTKAHQVGILKPGVIEAVLNGGTSPVEDQTVRIQVFKGFRYILKQNVPHTTFCEKMWCH